MISAWLYFVAVCCGAVTLMIPLWTRDALRDLRSTSGRFARIRLAQIFLVIQALLSMAVAASCCSLAVMVATGLGP